jgi:hypothetical protein
MKSIKELRYELAFWSILFLVSVAFWINHIVHWINTGRNPPDLLSLMLNLLMGLGIILRWRDLRRARG